MSLLDLADVYQYVEQNISTFHANRLEKINNLKLDEVLLRKNPYLFKAKNILTAESLVRSILDAYLSSSEEELFGKFLESLAIHVASQTVDGRKSSAEGIDLEFNRDEVHYLVSIKSGPNWGNSSQKKRLEDNFKTARRVQQQGRAAKQIQPVLGICYGRTRDANTGVYLKLVGQSFWYFISEDRELYLEIIEPIGFRAREHNEAFMKRRAALENRFTARFIQTYCHSDGTIDWHKLVAFNSENLSSD